MHLTEMRTRVRRDLRDTDPADERWSDDELDRHIERAVRELSLAAPLEAVATLTTASGSRDLDAAALAARVSIDTVEYPAGQYPPSYAAFSAWGDTLTLVVDLRAARRRARHRLLLGAAHPDRRSLDAARGARGDRRDGRGRVRGAGVGLVRHEPRQRWRGGHVAALPHLGAGTPRRLRTRARQARPRAARAVAPALPAAGRRRRRARARRVALAMRGLTPTLEAAQRSPSAKPYLRVQLHDRDVGSLRLRWQRVYSGPEPDGPCAAGVAGDGALLRVRIDPSTGALTRQRVAQPGLGERLRGVDAGDHGRHRRHASASPRTARAP